MREIKFRVWDGDSMLSLSKAVTIGLVVIQYDEADSFAIEPDYDHVELMQYTGLKDKNGVEIYEGDILEGNSGWVGDVFRVGSGAWCVNGSFVINFEYKPTVIGNIYEAPELLAQKNAG